MKGTKCSHFSVYVLTAHIVPDFVTSRGYFSVLRMGEIRGRTAGNFWPGEFRLPCPHVPSPVRVKVLSAKVHPY